MFRLLAPMALLVVCVWLVADAPSAAKDTKEVRLYGKVLNVEASKDAKDAGTLTLKTDDKKDKDGKVVEEGKELKIHVTKETKLTKPGEKATDPATPAAFADLQKGQHVRVTVQADKADVATTVRILFVK